MERRLDRLAVVYRRREPPAPPVYDFSGLTPREQLECDLLLAEVERAERRTGRADVSMLTAQERARLDALWGRVRRVR